jgi:hypothetical protein
MTTDNFCFYSQNRLIQTSQTGGQWYSDTSTISIPWQGSRLMMFMLMDWSTEAISDDVVSLGQYKNRFRMEQHVFFNSHLLQKVPLKRFPHFTCLLFNIK